MSTSLSYESGHLAVPVDDTDDHIRGPLDASVTLVEYGDYQCPYCGEAFPAVAELMRSRPNTVRLAYRQFPISNVHPQAEMAAEMAEAAATRSRFWEMHDWLFSNQQLLEDQSAVLNAAASFGLDPSQMRHDVEEHRYADRIRRDFVGGVRSGVNGTPTFFINDIRHDGGYSAADLIAAIDEAAAAWPTGNPAPERDHP